MGNREVQGRVLLPHQRKIWTEAFKASMHHTSIESAERKAWQAVDICERVPFNYGRECSSLTIGGRRLRS